MNRIIKKFNKNLKLRDTKPEYKFIERTIKNPLLASPDEKARRGELNDDYWVYIPWIIWDAIDTKKLGLYVINSMVNRINSGTNKSLCVVILYLQDNFLVRGIFCSDKGVNRQAWEGFVECMGQRETVDSVLIMDMYKETMREWTPEDYKPRSIK